MPSKKTQPNQSTFLSWLLSFFSPPSPEKQKKKQLRRLEKNIIRSRYKFYKPRNNQVLPGLAKFLFEIYKVTTNTRTLLSNAHNSGGIRSLCIKKFMDNTQIQILDSFEENAIRTEAKNKDPKEYADVLKERLQLFISNFDKNTINQIDKTYENVLRFIDFISFDYFFTLKKFDSHLQNEKSPHKFETISGDYVTSDIKDFIDIFLPIDFELDWNQIFDILSQYKNMEIINRSAWQRLLNISKNVASSGIFHMIIHYMEKDLHWKATVSKTKTRIVESYLTNLQKKIEKNIKEIEKEKINAQIDKLCMAVFESIPTQRLRYYTTSANEKTSNILKQFNYTIPMNYLQAFFTDYFHKEMRELVNLIIARGKWVENDLSKTISEPYYEIVESAEKITKFDDSLHAEGERGKILEKTLMKITSKDISTIQSAEKIVEEIDQYARILITNTIKKFIIFGTSIKNIITDISSKNHSFIINWGELNSVSDVSLKTRFSTEYKRLYNIVQLLKTFIT